ncbi:MAG: CehA/McbA family metallohydrolase [Terriglobia bacterium]
MKLKFTLGIFAFLALSVSITPRLPNANFLAAPPSGLSLQVFASQARLLETTLTFLGQPLAPADQAAINAAFSNTQAETAISQAETILDKYTLAVVTINAESRVSISQGLAQAELVQHGTRIFLVKVINQAGVTAPLVVESPNNGNVYLKSTNSPSPTPPTTGFGAEERWADFSLYTKAPLSPRLSGFALEYRVLLVSSRDAGQRAAQLSFNVGQGTEDIGFRNAVQILFNIVPAYSLTLRVVDENGKPTMASFIFRDALGRIYPNPAKRLAPDFFFQPQVYRADGEKIWLPPGSYDILCTGGPEYLQQSRKFQVDAESPKELHFALQRWIDPAKYGWFSGDHHLHAAGCSHYEYPSQGVLPKDIDRQVRGEHLNVGSVLTWGPCYYYQKQFFSGTDNPLSTPDKILHYDLEVSGFPSSHTGHLILLGLKDQDYPGTQRIESWPTWDLPILRWGKSQRATTGFAHSGWGLQLKDSALPNFDIPGFDGIGANEYIVDVTYPDTVDFISAGDTPYAWELNIWYQTLNVGFRTRISGETDFPCIYDSRVGEGREYAKVDGTLTYEGWLAALRQGRSYVSDGRSHLMELKVNQVEVGSGKSEVNLNSPGQVEITLKAAAYLDPKPDETVRQLPYDQKPYWNLDRARMGDTRKVPVELIVNGRPVATKEILADGNINELRFEATLQESSWVAVRILPSSHTNPLFVLVEGKPIRASRRSAEWCLASVNQCWTQKAPKISAEELPEAQRAYDHAREVYRKLIAECRPD